MPPKLTAAPNKINSSTGTTMPPPTTPVARSTTTPTPVGSPDIIVLPTPIATGRGSAADLKVFEDLVRILPSSDVAKILAAITKADPIATARIATLVAQLPIGAAPAATRKRSSATDLQDIIASKMARNNAQSQELIELLDKNFENTKLELEAQKMIYQKMEEEKKKKE